MTKQGEYTTREIIALTGISRHHFSALRALGIIHPCRVEGSQAFYAPESADFVSRIKAGEKPYLPLVPADEGTAPVAESDWDGGEIPGLNRVMAILYVLAAAGVTAAGATILAAFGVIG